MNYLHKLSDNAILVNAIQHSWDNDPEVKEMCTLPLNMAMMLHTPPPPVYCIAGNFRLEKIFAFFVQARRGRIFFRRIILPSEILSC